MKILIVKENGRHDENRFFGEAFNFKRAFERLGHQCKIWGLGHDNFDEPFDSFYNEYDVIFILENYDQTGWIPDLTNVNKLKVFFNIDSHCNPYGNVSAANKHGVDIVLSAIDSHQSMFQGKQTYYFPNSCPTDLIYPQNDIEKKYLMGFCGTPFGYRETIMDFIEKNTGLKIKKDTYVLGHNMVKSINSYKIHFNCSENADINSRVFETLGTKTCLLTTNNENILTHFEDMVDLVVYEMNDMSGLVEKIKYLINNETKIYEIAESGYKKLMKNHTYNNRAQEFIKIVSEFLNKK
jgi:hypothetical protein